MISVCFSMCCLIFISLLAIIYFSKQKLKNFDNKIYSTIIILNIVGIFIDIYGYFSFKHLGANCLINHIIAKVYLLYFVSYIFLLMIYTYNLTFKKLPQIIKKVLTIFTVVCLLIFLLPIKINYNNKYAYTYGLSVNVAYVFGLIFIIGIIICLIKAGKGIRKKAYRPLIGFVVLLLICIFIQKLYPQITLLLTVDSIVTFLMYFTIENPDVQVINELYRNKTLVEKAYDDKSTFLFRMTQEIRKPIQSIRENLNQIEQESNFNKIKSDLKKLNMDCKQLDFIVNDVLNITTLDYKHIKIVNNKYNIYTLIEDIKKKMALNNKDKIDYRFVIDEGIPYLYGDQIKLKQIIMSILLNSIKKTTSGFIELNINSIIKYDLCRLIITIEDSGSGMSLEKINELLITTTELQVDDIKNLEKLDLNLKMCQKTVNLLGGNLMIRSDVGKGTEVIITLDQKIYSQADTVNDLEINKLNLKNEKSILIATQHEKMFRMIKSLISDNNILYSNSLYGKDVIGKVKTGNIYDLLLINDDMGDMSGFSILQELKKLNYPKPIIILLNKNKEQIKDHYITDGFTDYILVDDLDKEIQRIKKKYL